MHTGAYGRSVWRLGDMGVCQGVCQVLFSPRIGLLGNWQDRQKANPEPGGMREAILPFREKYFDVLNGLYYY